MTGKLGRSFIPQASGVVPVYTDSLWPRVKGRFCQQGKWSESRTETDQFRERKYGARRLLHPFTRIHTQRHCLGCTAPISKMQTYMYGHSSIDVIATKVKTLERKVVRQKNATGSKQPLFQSRRFLLALLFAWTGSQQRILKSLLALSRTTLATCFIYRF